MSSKPSSSVLDKGNNSWEYSAPIRPDHRAVMA
jgi:hypothetical protein